jgi:signal transduction histidine kinase
MSVGEPGNGSTDLGASGRALTDRLDRLGSAISLAAAAGTLDELVVILSREARDLVDAESATATASGTERQPDAEATDGRSIGRTGRSSSLGGAGASPLGESGPATKVSREARIVQRLPMVYDGEVVGSLAVAFPEYCADPGEEKLALVRALAATAGLLIGRQRDRMQRRPGPADRDRTRPQDAGRAERMRIARELHDGLIQSLYGIGLLIRTQAERTDLPEKGRRRMHGWVLRIDGLVAEATAYVSGLEVRGDALVDLGAGIDAIAEEAAAAGLDVSTEVSSSDDARLSSEARHELLTVAREAASNAIRHAKAQRLALHVEIDPATETATLTVDDDGIGFEPALHRLGGHGLDNMAARAAALNGSLDVLSRRSAGTRVRLQIPMRWPIMGEGLNSDD